MEFLELSGAFATIVGLLSNFKEERSSTDLQDFIDWLRTERQEALANAITENKKLSHEISQVLSINHKDLVAQLEELNKRIALLASQFDGLSKLAESFPTGNLLSLQGRKILKQIALSGAEFLMERKTGGHAPAFVFISGTVGQLQYDESRFIEEDISVLQQYGLIRIEISGVGMRKLFATRNGVEYAKYSDG